MAFARWVENFMLSNPTFLGITAVSWLTFAGVWLAAFIVLRWTRHIVFKRLHALAARTATSLDDLGEGLVRRTSTTFLLLLALYFGISTLPLASDKQSIVSMAMLVVVLVQSGLWAHEVVDYAIRELVRRDSDLDSGLRTAAGAIGFAGRVLVWSVILILILSNLHVNVTTLIAGLGVGGVAIALAVQNVLGDLFASLSILVDQPFVVGHFIVIDDLAGTVEHVGLKTTRIRSLSGEQVVMSNADLLKSRIHNYKLRRDLQHRIRKAGRDSSDGAPDSHRHTGHAFRSRPLQGIRRLFPEFRGGLFRAGSGLQPLHGRAAAN
jgi:small-conductance mechanosensitive channel